MRWAKRRAGNSSVLAQCWALQIQETQLRCVRKAPVFLIFLGRKTWYKMPLHYLYDGKNEVGWNPKIAGSLEAQR